MGPDHARLSCESPQNISLHGLKVMGLEKKPYLELSRSATEIDLMRTIKAALDPKGILNPGKIFDRQVA